MEKKTTKIVASSIFFVLIFTAFFLSIFFEFPAEWNIKISYISFGCVCATFLFSILFVGKNLKKIFIALALASIVVGEAFFKFGAEIQNYILIGMCVFCVAQLFLLLYTLVLNKGIGAKVINLAIRVALCLLAYFIIPNYYVLTTLQMIAVMYFINLAVTLLYSLFYIKTEYMLFLGLVLLVLASLVLGFKSGGIELFNLSGKFIDILLKYDWTYYFYIPALFFIAFQTVLGNKNQ